MRYNVYKSAEAEENRRDTDWGFLQWLASRQIGNAEGMTLGRVVIKPGKSNPAHSHPNCEEALYLMRGRLRHFMGDQQVVLEAGDTLTVDAGIPHYATNIGREDAEMIVAYSSGDRQFEEAT